MLLAILSTLAGHFWAPIMYPIARKRDTIKATHMIQIFPSKDIPG
jgi:hypothetical protein